MGARILVADDSVTIQKVVELTFSKEDFQLIQARSGEEAIRKAKDERPDLILLDLVMPDKNGYEVCQVLRAEPTLRDTPIIFLAGTFESLDKERATAAGASDFVNKPFESQALVSKVKQLLFARAVDPTPRPAPAASIEPASAAILPPPVSRAEPPAPVAPPPEPSRPPLDPVWQLLEQADRAAQPHALEPTPAPSFGDAPGLENGLDLDLLPEHPTGEAPGAAGADTGSLPVPGSLSLDDLLAAETAPEAGAPPEPVVPVFELAEEDLPGLPLAEAEVPPPLRQEPASTQDDVATGELDFDALAKELRSAPLPVEPAAEPVPATPELGESPMASLDLEEAVPVAEPLTPAAPTPTSLVEIPAEPAGFALLASPGQVAPSAEDPEALRRAVAARVAEQLAKELSQKLMERIERVVWEVVPDLAEILISKEMERIRQQAEEQKSA